MNNRARTKKRVEKGRRKLIHKLLDVVLDINGINRRAQLYTRNQPTIFFELLGNVAIINVRLHAQGWASGQNWDKAMDVHMYSTQELLEAIEQLKCETPAAGTARESCNA